MHGILDSVYTIAGNNSTTYLVLVDDDMVGHAHYDCEIASLSEVFSSRSSTTHVFGLTVPSPRTTVALNIIALTFLDH